MKKVVGISVHHVDKIGISRVETDDWVRVLEVGTCWV